jgi:hypothetical protein
LAAIRFVETRKIAGHETKLREALTDHPKGAVGAEIAAASIDALLATGLDPKNTAKFLALVATGDHPAIKSHCERGVRQLGSPAHEAILDELGGLHPPTQLRSLARMLTGLSDVRSPEPIPFWQNADVEARKRAAEEWRSRIRSAKPSP